MKPKLLTLGLFLLFTSFSFIQNSNAQCAGPTVSFDDETLFPTNSVTADGTNTMSALEVGTPADIWDATIGAPGMDGIDDVQFSWQAFTYTSPGNTNGLGNFTINGTGGSNDFGASGGNNDAGGGYIVLTIDYLNGFSSTATGFNLPWTSNNGSCECYEYSFGFVTMAQDASGNPITGLNTTAAVTTQIEMYTYSSQYNAGGTLGPSGAMTGAFTPIGDFSLASTTGIFTNNADDQTANNVDNTSTGDVNSGSGPNNGGSSGPITGLGATDEITQVVYIYGVNNASGPVVGGQTGVSTTPGGSLQPGTACPPVPPCGYTFDVATEEVCGEFTIDITNIVGQGDADPVSTAAYDVIINSVTVLTGVTGISQLAIAGTPAFVADGSTTYSVVLQLSSDATCMSDPLDITAPAGTSPNVPTFIPNNPTTGN